MRSVFVALFNIFFARLCFTLFDIFPFDFHYDIEVTLFSFAGGCVVTHISRIVKCLHFTITAIFHHADLTEHAY